MTERLLPCGLSEKCSPCELMYLSMWSVVRGTVWEGLGSQLCWRMYISGGVG